MMIDQNKILAEMTKQMRYLFEQGRSVMQTVFEHWDRLVDFLVGQENATQSEVRKQIKEWLDNAKRIRDEYIKMMSEQIQKIENFYKQGDRPPA